MSYIVSHETASSSPSGQACTARAEGEYSCALVEWFSTYGNLLCKDTGLWMVEPDYNLRGKQMCSVIHIDTILHSAHLNGVACLHFIPKTLLIKIVLTCYKPFM